MSNLKIARAWVLESGRDCDGAHTRGKVICCKSLYDANTAQAEASEWSDGMTYQLTEKWSEVVEYCMEYERDPANYIYSDYDPNIHHDMPAHWASALINNDYSGLEFNESHVINFYLEDNGLVNCIAVSEESFPKMFEGLLTECATYTFAPKTN